MGQILHTLGNPSLQDIYTLVAIFGTIATIMGMFFEREGIKKDLHIFIHHIPQPEPVENEGCLTRSILYVIFVFCAILLILLPFIHVSIITPPSPNEEARAVVQDFYNDINKRDYHAAYSLLKDGLSQTYDQFAKGYEYTKHDEISFEDIEQLPNGNIEVTIEIKATENPPTGQHTSFYSAIYILAKDGNTYIILNGCLYLDHAAECSN